MTRLTHTRRPTARNQDTRMTGGRRRVGGMRVGRILRHRLKVAAATTVGAA